MLEDYMGNLVPEFREEMIQLRIAQGNNGIPHLKADHVLGKAVAELKDAAYSYWQLDDCTAMLVIKDCIETINSLRDRTNAEYAPKEASSYGKSS